jgi:adenylate cyclase
MMAIFNAPIDLPRHQDRAVKTALDIVENMKRANEEIKRRGIDHEIKIGIGVNTGKAVIGNMGSETRFDYSAIGDAVNLGARLESATKELGVDILVGCATVEGSFFAFEELEPIKVKGKEDEIKIFTIRR